MGIQSEPCAYYANTLYKSAVSLAFIRHFKNEVVERF